MLKRNEIRIRDPFILVENGKYYMYGTTAFESNSNISALASTYVYISDDLESFSGPKEVFNGEGFWADRDYWAPEVHKYNGKYYMFISLKSENHRRCTQILACDTPDGSFKPISDSPATPEEWEALDGTLWVENGTPYMVFCHEWVQIGDGEICVVELSRDLTSPVGEPKTLFKASDNHSLIFFDGSSHGQSKPCLVTDGPFLYEEDGKLCMLWSSLSKGNYLVLKAVSDGGVLGKWTQSETPVFDKNGGHAMLFTDLNGDRRISLHQPNTGGLERACFFPFEKK